MRRPGESNMEIATAWDAFCELTGEGVTYLCQKSTAMPALPPKPSWSYLYNAYANAKSATITVDLWKQIVCQLSYPRFSIFNISGSTYWAA